MNNLVIISLTLILLTIIVRKNPINWASVTPPFWKITTHISKDGHKLNLTRHQRQLLKRVGWPESPAGYTLNTPVVTKPSWGRTISTLTLLDQVSDTFERNIKLAELRSIRNLRSRYAKKAMKEVREHGSN